MKGANELRLNEDTMRAALKGYFDKTYAAGCSPDVLSIDMTEVPSDPANYNAPKVKVFVVKTQMIESTGAAGSGGAPVA